MPAAARSAPSHLFQLLTHSGHRTAHLAARFTASVHSRGYRRAINAFTITRRGPACHAPLTLIKSHSCAAEDSCKAVSGHRRRGLLLTTSSSSVEFWAYLAKAFAHLAPSSVLQICISRACAICLKKQPNVCDRRGLDEEASCRH